MYITYVYFIDNATRYLYIITEINNMFNKENYKQIKKNE